MPSHLNLSILVSLLLAPAADAAQMLTETHVQVQAAGAVARPGLYRLGAGARVAELVQRAGGPKKDADLHAINLARKLEDGERCHIPIRGAAPAGLTMTTSHRRAKRRHTRRSRPHALALSTRINLNQAQADHLQLLPGVGPSMAKRILAVRQKLGGFSAIEDLQEVPGIGEKRLARLRPYLTL